MQWGIVDVRSWLRTLPRGTLDQWQAFDSVEPIGERWLQTSKILQKLAALFGLQAAIASEKTFELPEVEDYMPERYVAEEKKKKPKPSLPSVEEQKKMFQGLVKQFNIDKEI